MRLQFLALAIGFLLLLPVSVSADQGVVARYVPAAKKVGSARLSFLFWDVYDATLYAPGGRWDNDTPFALAIRYLRDLKGEAIAKRSRDEMEKLGFSNETKLDAWLEQMAGIFPDVEEATVLTGVRNKDGRTFFYKKDIRVGIIKDPEFADWFFGIWLNEKTSEPQMRKELLGLTD